MKNILPIIILFMLTAVTFADTPTPVWDITKAHRQTTSTRETICINGLWQWQPATDETTTPPTENWGYFKVPGSWPGITNYMQKDSQIVHTHEAWKDTKIAAVTKAWYQREIEIPANWKDRRVLLKADYVNSRAVAYIDGKRVGEILFPAGEIDLTEACEPGKKYMLSLEVTALPLSDVITLYTDTNASRTSTATVARRGLCGDVFLVGVAKTPRISDVKIETSVRKGEITVTAALENTANFTPFENATMLYSLEVYVYDGEKLVRHFASPPVPAAHVGKHIILTEKWMPEKLWDIHTPENMYEARVQLRNVIHHPTKDVMGGHYDAGNRIPFGFREFWIEGRDLYLNGSRIWLSCVPLDNAQIGAALANYEAAKETMLRLKSFGVNFVYTHNYDCNPGSFISFSEILKAADDVGMLVAFSMPHFGNYDWNSPDAEKTNGYERLAKFLVDEAKNHPSVVFYSMSHNSTGYAEDMNPDLMDGIAAPRSRWAENNLAKARRAEEIVKKLDPGRIVYHHASGNLGPMHLSNFYVNWVPVQEMSDWFGHWAAVGTKPMFTCEYGVPFTWDWAMYRGWYHGVREFGSAPAPWEFCNAEWNAQFVGDAAYKIGEPEKRNLRWEARQFHDGKVWYRWDYPHPLGAREFTDQDPILAKYINDNWRAFRTWGLSINSYWEYGRLWSLKPGVDKSREEYTTDWENLQRPGFSPDFQDQRYERIDIAYEREDWVPSEGAKALMRNNSPLLGYIAGGSYIAGEKDKLTNKDHNYLPGETVEKQLVIVNNSRKAIQVPYLTTSVSFDPYGGVGGSGERVLLSGEIFTRALGQPIKLPKNLKSGAYDIRVEFDFRDGGVQEDTFTIHVLPKPEPIPAMNIALYDPKDETAKMLDELGVAYRTVQNASEIADTDAILILGKDALDISGDGFDLSKLPDGLKVIVFEQTAETLEKRLGFRTAQYGLRQVFTRIADHPILAGIESENLRDWRGSATLLPERLDYKTDEQVFNGVPTVEWCGITVPRVWRCGNRGNVASVLIEKPACGDFLPIVDGGFALQYSPLMEYRQGAGMIFFCQMDVTGRSENDPAAVRMVGNMLRYVKEWKAKPKMMVEYYGDETGKTLLKKMGVTIHGPSKAVGRTVLILGPDGVNQNFKVPTGRIAAEPKYVDVKDEISRRRQSKYNDPVLALGLNEDELKIAFPELAVKTDEHISTYFEPFGMDSPLRGIGPADVHNRDPKNYPLVTDGANVVGNGILAVTDEERTVICGLAPWQFPAGKQSFKKTFCRSSFTLSRLLGNMNVDLRTPLPTRFHGQVAPDEKRWLDGLYLDEPTEWDDPYRFFRW